MQIPKRAIIYTVLIFCLSFLVISSVPYPDNSSNAYDRDPFGAERIFHLDDPTGAINITDSSASNIYGTVYNASIVDGKTNFSTAMCFDGANGNISTSWGNATSMGICDAWTISFWTNSTTLVPGAGASFFSVSSDATNSGTFQARIFSPNITFEYGNLNSISETLKISFEYGFRTGEWQHFTFAKAQGCTGQMPGLLRVYANATEITDINTEYNNSLLNYSFRANVTFVHGGPERFRGCFDDLLFFRTNLTQGQISQIYLGNYTSGTPSINATSPINNTLNNSMLGIEYNVSDPNGDRVNITLFLNGTINATNLNIVTSPNGTLSNFNISGLLDGTHQYILQACDNSLGCRNSTPKIYRFDNTSGTIIFNNPSGFNRSFSNLTLNISVNDTNFLHANVTVWTPQNTILFQQNTTGRLIFNATVNFTTNGNFTVEVIVTDGDNTTGVLTTVRENRSWFYDLEAPRIAITTPSSNGSTITTSTVSFVTIVNDTIHNDTISCTYRTTTVGGITDIGITSYNCNNATFTPTLGDITYILIVNNTDGRNTNETSINFILNTAVVQPSGGGGGGGGTTTAEKVSCNIEITPLNVFIGLDKKIQEIKVTNNEDFTYTPELGFIAVGEDRTAEVALTNLPGTIVQKQTSSFGIQYLGEKSQQGQVNMIMTSEKCKDITIPLNLNVGLFVQVFEGIFNPAKSFSENIVDISFASPIPSLPAFKNYMLYGVVLLISTLLTLKRIIKEYEEENKGVVISLIVFDLLFSAFATIVIFAITR